MIERTKKSFGGTPHVPEGGNFMTPENQKKYDEKYKRIHDAIELKEPDRVPITPAAELFPVLNAGYTVAEVVYDYTLEKSRKAAIK